MQTARPLEASRESWQSMRNQQTVLRFFLTLIVETNARLAKDVAGANVTIGVKVGNFSKVSTKDERLANGGIHAGKLVVLEFQGRNVIDGIESAGHDTRKLVVGQVQKFNAAVTHAGVVGRNPAAQLIVVDHEHSHTVQRRRCIRPVGG